MDTTQKANATETKISVIVPTLNEEGFIDRLLKSLERQICRDFEIIIVDGGSNDRTLQIAKKHNAKVITRRKTPEFESRNIGAKAAKGQILLFTSADVIFPIDLMQKVIEEFIQDPALSAISGSGTMYNAPLWAKIEYNAYYTLMRFWVKATRDFHGSTNFMAVRKKDFIEMKGFKERIDSDGNFLNKLATKRKVKFISTETLVSGRRAARMGFFKFNAHFLHLIDVFFPFLRETKPIDSLKRVAKGKRLEALKKSP